jgi:hypothetical protein
MKEIKPFEWIPHFGQIADTGDHDGEYELSNGGVSLFTKEIDDESMFEIQKALNDSGAIFYTDPPERYELFNLKHQIDSHTALIKEMKEALSKLYNAIDSSVELTPELLLSVRETLSKS